MLTRSFSSQHVYTLAKPPSHNQLDLLASDITPTVSGSRTSSTPTAIASMPRSISLQKLNGNLTTPFKTHHTTHSLAFPLRPTRASTTVELVEDNSPTSANSDTLPPMHSRRLGDTLPKLHLNNSTNDDHTPPSPHFAPSSTSPEGQLITEAGSLPIALRHPIVGNALIHPPPNMIDTTNDANRNSVHPRLPPALVEDFEIVGRAGGGVDGGESTCDTWIVRSKCSGKLAVFKPRDGELFEQRKQFEEQELARREREERMKRLKARMSHGNNSSTSEALMAPASSSCPHPLSIPTSLRTPIKRGVVYGETTRKEVAAYLMDHEHFAGVPKTLEATIWLERQDAPNGGVNTHESGIENYHPYLHQQSQLALTAGSNSHSPELASTTPGRLLLKAASNSPSLSTSTDPIFSFDPEEVWLPGPANPHTSDGSERALIRSPMHGGSEEDDYGAQTRHIWSSNVSSNHSTPPLKSMPRDESHAPGRSAVPFPPPSFHHNSNLHPPTLFPPSHSTSPTTTPTGANGTPELISSNRSTPDEFRSLGLPATKSELVATYGSLQEFVENRGSAEDCGSAAFPVDEVHRIGILDVRLLNLDRHLGNLLVQRDHAGKPHLIPIDHGFILPSYQELQDVHLEWTFWRQCMEPFSETTLRYIDKLDPIADAAKLRNLGIRDEALVSMVFSSLLLKHAAASGLTLYHIAQMVQRDGVGDEPSTLEVIVSRVLGSQQASPAPASEEEVTPSPVPNPATHAFTFDTDSLPSVEEEQFSPSTSRQSTSSTHISRENSSSANGAPALISPLVSPDRTINSTVPITLLTRSNSDGAMALAEAISSGRPFNVSSNTNNDSEKKEEEMKRPTTRRASVVDAAKQIIALVDGASSLQSPTLAPQSHPFETSSNPTPPPPSMIRLGTELTLHTTANEIPMGQNKIQHLLLITETVIREELAKYCAKNGLSPTSTASTTATTPTKEPTESEHKSPSHMTLNTTTSPRLSPRVSPRVMNTTIGSPSSGVNGHSFRPPKSPLRTPFSLSSSTSAASGRSASFDSSPLTMERHLSEASGTSFMSPTSAGSILSPMSGAGAASSMSTSIRRSRSGSIEASTAPSSRSSEPIRATALPQHHGFSSPPNDPQSRRQLAAAMATEAHTPTAITAES